MSMRPNCSTAVVISRAMSPGQVTSVAMKRAIPPSAAISATRLSPSVTRRPAATIVAPARAKASAAARPMPLPAPVMTAILPAKSAIGRSLMVQDGGTLDDAFQLRRRVEHAEDGGPVALQPRGAERREDIGLAVIVQLARLQGIGHRGAESPRMAVIVAVADDLVAQAIEPAVELPVGAARPRHLAHEGVARPLVVAHGAQHVHAHHVGRAFPNAVERRLAIESRHRILLDEAVAAMAFERLDDEGGGAFAVPELGERRRDAGEAAFLFVISHGIDGARDAEGHQGRGFAVDR